jgi:hypothetical protein
MLAALTGLFDRALTRGEISGVSAEMAAHLVIAPILKSVMWALVFGKVEEVPFPPAPYLRTHVQIFLRGVNHKGQNGEMSDGTV